MAEKKIELLKQENELNSARRYIEGLEEECKYFAKELHDGIANDLLGLQMKIETSAGKGNEQELASLVSKLRNNVRNISHELMPPEFEHLSLDQILDRYAAKLTENTGIEVSYHPCLLYTSGTGFPVTQPVEVLQGAGIVFAVCFGGCVTGKPVPSPKHYLHKWHDATMPWETPNGPTPIWIVPACGLIRWHSTI